MLESWLAMCDLIKTLKSQRAQQVLVRIFADPKVCSALRAAKQLRVIETVDNPPNGLLIQLKDGPSAHLKANYFEYVKSLKTEIAHIERIQALQHRAIGLVATGIVSVSVGIANFVARIAYYYYGPDSESDS